MVSMARVTCRPLIPRRGRSELSEMEIAMEAIHSLSRLLIMVGPYTISGLEISNQHRLSTGVHVRSATGQDSPNLAHLQRYVSPILGDCGWAARGGSLAAPRHHVLRDEPAWGRLTVALTVAVPSGLLAP